MTTSDPSAPLTDDARAWLHARGRSGSPGKDGNPGRAPDFAIRCLAQAPA